MRSTFFKLRGQVFYGWIIVLAVIASGFVMMGTSTSFGVFFMSLEEAYDLTRASTSAILSVRMIFNAAAAFLAGWAIDRFGPRRIFSAMGFFIGLSMLSTGLTTEAWQIFISYGFLMSIGTGPVYVVMTSTVLRWFSRRRGLALGLAGAGGGIGTALISPVSAYLISSQGWRYSIILLGGLSWLIMLPAAQLLKSDPRDIGSLPDGEPLREQGTEVETMATIQSQPSLKQTILTQSFWAILFIWFTMAFSSFFIMTHIVPHALDIGFSPVESAAILSFSGIAMMTGRLSAGIISDRVNVKVIAIVSCLIQFIAVISLIWVREIWLLYLFGLVHGLTFGSFGTAITVLIGRTFTLSNIGKVLGILELGIFTGGAIGPYLGGFIFDTRGSYSSAFILMSMTVLLRILFVMLVKPVTTRAVQAL